MSDLLYSHALESMANQRIQDYIREADVDHLQSELHPSGTGWWSRHARQSLRGLGHMLQDLGHYLESLNRPDVRPI